MAARQQRGGADIELSEAGARRGLDEVGGDFRPWLVEVRLQHAVVVVGYGTSDDGVAYWKVKNSFGAAWGESGYFKIARGSDTCGVEDNVVVPIAA